MKKTKISIVIPVYNSSLNLKNLIDSLHLVLKDNFAAYEVVLVDDMSTDDSWNVISELCMTYSWIKAIRLRLNIGQHNAIQTGLYYTTGDLIVTMDDDGQNSPKDIILLADKLEEQYEVCYADYPIKKHNILRKFFSSLNNLIVSFLFNKPYHLKLTSFRCFTFQIKNELLKNKSPSVYLDGLIISITRNITSVTVEHNERKYGKSNYTFVKLFSLWIQMFTGFSVKPLRLASILGIIFSLTSFLVTFWLIFFRSPSSDVPMGWTSIIVVVIFFGGIQLLALGLIGEYLGRTYLTVNNQSYNSIKDKINLKD